MYGFISDYAGIWDTIRFHGYESFTRDRPLMSWNRFMNFMLPMQSKLRMKHNFDMLKGWLTPLLTNITPSLMVKK